MAETILLPTFSDQRGDLTVFEKLLPSDIKRIFYIRNGKGIRGEKKHLKAHQAMMSLNGTCKVKVNQSIFELNDPSLCLLLSPGDEHSMYDFSEDNILLVLSTEYYDTQEFTSVNKGGEA